MPATLDLWGKRILKSPSPAMLAIRLAETGLWLSFPHIGALALNRFITTGFLTLALAKFAANVCYIMPDAYYNCQLFYFPSIQVYGLTSYCEWCLYKFELIVN